jgi:regulator of sigma E protease
MHDFLVSAVAFVVLVGLMVIVHELGHFTVAKLCRVRVEAFSIGFGPRLFGVKYGETDYKVCLLPLGGFVKMTGESPTEAEPVDDPAAFTSHPRWQRMLIGLAGPVANFILALVLMFVYYGFINEVPSVQVNTTSVEWVTPNSAAAEAGFQSGDVIRTFDGLNNPQWEPGIFEHIKLNPNTNLPVTVERAGQTLNLSLHIPSAAKDDDFDIGDTGLQPQFMPGPIQVTEVQAGTPAAAAGLKAGDSITSVDGHAFHSITTLLAYMQAEKGKAMNLSVLRDGATIPITATPAKIDQGYRLGFVYQPQPYRSQPLSFGPALSKSLAFCKENSWVVFEMLERLFTHRVSVSQLVGPVGIARAAGQAAEMNGWMPKFGLAGMISLNLGILNLMPFPILDGGLILLLLIESVLRHDISLAVKERIYQAAFVLIMVFMVFVIFNDVSKLPMFTHLKP